MINASSDTHRTVPSGLTIRAVGIGVVLSILSCIWAIHTSYNANSSLITISHIPIAALFPFVLTVFLLNPAIKFLSPRRGLSPQELIIIFFLVFTASSIPGWAFSSYWLGVISGPLYFASPENRWVETFFQYLPDWLIVSNYSSVAWFYEGLPDGESMLWQFWVTPLFWWSLFFLAIFLVGASLIVILRKQWIEHERLVFPLAQIPLAMIKVDREESLLPAITGNRFFWIGFGTALGVLFWQMLSFFNVLPEITILALYKNNLLPARSFPEVPITFNFLTAGVAFFTHTNVLLSTWLFFLIKTFQTGVMVRVGVPRAPWVATSQHMGGFIVFVLFTLWMARRHLTLVWRKAVGLAPDVDDSKEFLSYRTALFCLFFGLLFIFAWLQTSGMSLGIAAFLMGSLLLMFIGITRIVAETGLIFVDLPYNAHAFTVSTIGSGSISPMNLTQLALSNAYSHNWRTLGMCSMAHVSKVGDQMGVIGRGVFGVITVTLAIGVITTVLYTLYLGYFTGGAQQFTDPPFPGGSRGSYNTLVNWLNNKRVFSGVEFFFMAIGSVVGGVLIFIHHRFPGWPLHPIGYAVAATEGMPTMAFSIFIAWLAKVLLLRIGGVTQYRKAQPFVVGMIAGYTVGIFLLYIVDIIWFPGNGHRVHMY